MYRPLKKFNLHLVIHDIFTIIYKNIFATNATSITTFIISQIVVIFGTFSVQLQNFFLQKETKRIINACNNTGDVLNIHTKIYIIHFCILDTMMSVMEKLEGN